MLIAQGEGREAVRIVAALGGNALLRRRELPGADAQREHIETAVGSIAALAAEHEVVVTHGNGPQVGLLALQAPHERLDVLGAETEGLIGYLLEQGIANALPALPVATLLTQILVDPLDPAFTQPTKPIGPVYTLEEAERLTAERGWTVAADGADYRRVVPSPEPLAIVEIQAIRLLVEHGVLVVCVGGGGIPVVADEDGALRGTEAVIDKDLAACLLAVLLEADFLLMLTDVPFVERAWGTPDAEPIRLATPEELRPLEFASGSMAPKVEAACRFAEKTGGRSAIGALGDAAAIVRGEAGTTVAAAISSSPRRRTSRTR
jgi:carbamate kinase